jgi:transposase
MTRRYALTDAEWSRLHELFPERLPAGPGRKPRSHRLMVDGALWVTRTGAPWRDLPKRFGPWQTVYDRYNRWRKSGTWDSILARLESHEEAFTAA